ncbi:hypothetical protein [Paracoccus marcusii]|uniref:Uncharacterized protein n=1 Tax=Paracoccus marcusii TaxID=59779 RepID=A0ABY7UND2_9RHOB|nr:hypothetical protein [Paracoccus marcusii]WDA11430.1 hypothetical protein PRL19_08860 [Paracoccus marcusii]
MTRFTQEMRDEITSAMLGIVERFDVDPIDMPPLAHAAAAECFRIVEALDRGRAVITGKLPPNWEAISQAITVVGSDDAHQWDKARRMALPEGARL